MAGFTRLLKDNRNYRYTWFGQVVSEFGDHFNNIAVFSLALANTKSGIVVSAIMLSRAVPMLMASPEPRSRRIAAGKSTNARALSP